MSTPVTQQNALEFLRLDDLMREIERAEAARSLAAVTRSIVRPRVDVHLGPETVSLVPRVCAPGDLPGNDPAAEGMPEGLSNVG